MVKFSFQHVYHYPWELVLHTHLTKYPTEKEKNIIGAKVVDSRRGQGNNLYLKMVVTCVNVLPSVFRKLKVLDVPHIYYEEDCWIDIEKRFAQLKSTPVGYEKFAVMNESSTFCPAEKNPQWTQFKQEGIIEMVGFGRLSWLLEMFAAKFLTRGARNNVNLMEELIKEKLANFTTTKQ